MTNTQAQTIVPTDITVGATVRDRGYGQRFGTVVQMRYAGASVEWQDRIGQAPTWHGYGGLEIV